MVDIKITFNSPVFSEPVLVSPLMETTKKDRGCHAKENSGNHCSLLPLKPHVPGVAMVVTYLFYY